MPITFNCPQGHRLTCPDELSGKPGKCPKCGTVVRVPPARAPLSAPADEPASALESAADGVTQSELGSDQIIFLCPNGHRLHGAMSLAGRPGQCPHCGVKFLVPGLDEEEEDALIEEEEPPAAAGHEFVIQIDTSGKIGSSKSGKASGVSSARIPASAHALAALLGQLWRYKAQGAAIEIHLCHVDPIEPEQVSFKDAQHALLGTRDAEGQYVLTVVAWSSIERIVIRRLEKLPKEWFAS